MFTHWLTLWNLQVDGELIKTHNAQLLPVLCDGASDVETGRGRRGAPRC